MVEVQSGSNIRDQVMGSECQEYGARKNWKQIRSREALRGL